MLQDYFAENAGVTLAIKDDSAAQTAKEILIGKTNRAESGAALSENELSVSVQNGKLIFNGGHDVTVDTAVQRFTRLPYTAGKANLFSAATDFSSAAALDGYTYVWGDEFEGDGLDLTKWNLSIYSATTRDTEISRSKNMVDAQDGVLKLHSFRTPNLQNSKYKAPATLSTDKSMNWQFGYVEMRARVPQVVGSWPSLWACSSNGKDTLLTPNLKNFVGEIDIFEAYGSNYIISNLHNHKNGGLQIDAYPGWTEKSTYRFENIKKLSDEYHTYGMLWTPTEIKMYIDGYHYVTYDLTKNITDPTLGEFDMSVFRDCPFTLLISNSIHTETIEQSGNQPICYYIDYIRLYQKQGEGQLLLGKYDQTYTDR